MLLYELFEKIHPSLCMHPSLYWMQKNDIERIEWLSLLTFNNTTHARWLAWWHGWWFSILYVCVCLFSKHLESDANKLSLFAGCHAMHPFYRSHWHYTQPRKWVSISINSDASGNIAISQLKFHQLKFQVPNSNHQLGLLTVHVGLLWVQQFPPTPRNMLLGGSVMINCP